MRQPACRALRGFHLLFLIAGQENLFGIFPRQLLFKMKPQRRHVSQRPRNRELRGQFHQSAQFSIPRPLAYVPSLRLHFEEKLAGKNAKEIFLTGDEKEQMEAAERSARWLAHFHQWAPRSGEFSSPEAGLARMERWALRFCELGGALSENAQLLFKRLRATFLELG